MGKTVITFSDPRAKIPRFAQTNRETHFVPHNSGSSETDPLIPESGAHSSAHRAQRSASNNSESSSSSEESRDHRKEEDVNKFMQKKTGAQGFINFALLGSNAAQLKRIWSTDNEPKFYNLLITLIAISIALQVVQLILMFVIGICLDMNIKESHPLQIVANNLVLLLTSLSLGVNFLLSALDMAN